MKFPQGIRSGKGSRKTHVLKLTKNLYGQKQAGRVWFKYLADKLKKIGFKQSAVDECVFYRGPLIFFFYVDDEVFICKENKIVDDAIKQLRYTGLELKDQGD